MPNIDLSILNQRQTPAFYADTLANRPAAGFVGRIFVSTNTLDLYRDNGTTWDLLSPSSTGTITGSGAAGQVTYFSAASSITGSNNLFWDSTNNRLGVNTNAPTASFDVHSASNTIAQFNQTVATNDTRIAFQNSGSSLWRIGNLYNAGANDFEIFDVVGALQSLTVKKTTGQVLIGTSTVGSGKLVVRSASSDNGIQIVGATAPSLRIDSAETGPTKRIGLAIATNTNNFIQGSADRDMCIFNGSTTASPMLFGIYDAGAVSVQEAARISAARNFLIGTTTDSGQKLIVSGTALITGAATFNNSINVVSTNPYLLLNDTSGSAAGSVVFLNQGVQKFNLATQASTNDIGLYNNGGTNSFNFYIKYSTGNFLIGSTTDTGAKLQVSGTAEFTGSVGIGNTINPSYKLAVSGNTYITGATSTGADIALIVQNSSLTNLFYVINNGVVNINNLAGTGSRAVLADANGFLSAPISDISVKQNIINIGYGLNEILKMNPIWFDFIDGYKNYGEGRQNGNIAQEMEQIIPEAVFLTQSTNKKGINYDQLHAVYIKAIQELNYKIENLK